MELATNASEPEILSLFEQAQSSLMPEIFKQQLEQKKMQFLQQFGSSAHVIKTAFEQYERRYGAIVTGRKRLQATDSSEPMAKVPRINSDTVSANDGEATEQDNQSEQQALMQQQWAAYQAAVQANAVNPVQAAAYYQAATAGQQAMWPFQQQFQSQQQQQT
jgi:uncharacterized membrane-anchored protein YhcB (DUF1043 family)